MSEERILIVEDEVKIARVIQLQLIHQGYKVDMVTDGRNAINSVKTGKYDLMVLDIMMPGIDGVEVCKRVREFSEIPIIMLTAKDDISDKIIGFDSGADDYVTKPFVFAELSARIMANLRKMSKLRPENKVIKVKDLEMNQETYEVIRAGQQLDLSKTEFELLQLLLVNKGIVMTREKILNRIWGYSYEGNDNILDVYIKYLRDKVDKPFEEKLIKTIRGIGYTIKGEE